MSDSEGQSRSARFKGETPTWKGQDTEEWEIRIVTRRTTNADETATCAVTGETVPLNEPHYFVTSTHPTAGRFQPEEYDHAIVTFEGGLEELARELDLE